MLGVMVFTRTFFSGCPVEHGLVGAWQGRSSDREVAVGIIQGRWDGAGPGWQRGKWGEVGGFRHTLKVEPLDSLQH